MANNTSTTLTDEELEKMQVIQEEATLSYCGFNNPAEITVTPDFNPSR